MISTLFITILTSIVSLEVYTSHLHDIIGYDLHYTTGFSTKSSISWPVAAGGLCPALGLAEVMRAAQQIGWEAAWKASAWRRNWAQIYDPKLGLECLERLRMVLFKLNSDG